MGRKIREITVVIIIMLTVMVIGYTQVSKSLAVDTDKEPESVLGTEDKDGTEGTIEPEEPDGPKEPEEPDGPEPPERPDRPVEKYEFKCPAPDGKNGYYVTAPKIEIIHVSEYGITKYRFTDSEGGTAEGELKESGDRVCIGPDQFKDGGNSIYVWMEDEEGVQAEDSEYSKELYIDTAPPDIQLRAPRGLDAWYQKQVMLNVKGDDGDKGSQVEQISVYAGKQLLGTTSNSQAAFQISQTSVKGNGVSVTVAVADRAGNKKEVTRKLYIDGTPPETAIQGIDNYMITSRPAEVHFQAEDDNVLSSASAKIVRESPEGELEELTGNKWESDGRVSDMRRQLSEDGIYKMELTASDKAGFSRSQTAQIIIDKKNPVIRYVDELDNRVMREFQWEHPMEEAIKDFTSYVYEIRLDGKIYTPGKKVKTEGVHTLRIKAVDAAGNEAAAQARFLIDRTPPEILFEDVKEGETYEEECTFKVTVKDGNDTIEGIWLDGEKQAVNPRSKVYQYTVQEYGEHIVLVRACDRAGNRAETDVGFKVVKKETILDKIINPVRQRLVPEQRSTGEAAGKTDHGSVKKRTVFLLSAAAAGSAAGIAVYKKRRRKK